MKYLKNVSTLKLDAAKCTGCTMCVKVCPHNVFVIENHKAQITDSDLCMECGACKRNCAFDAIEVNEGVGCAYAVYLSRFRKSKEISCGCSDSGSSCCG